MMMAALEAGGLRAARSDVRDRRHNTADGEYRPNPHGLYELPVEEMWEPGWPRQYDGMAVKCLARWVRHLTPHDYRVVFMLRDLEEVRQSYRAAFDMNATIDQLRAMRDEALRTLANRKDIRDVTTLDYADVLANPVAELERLGWPIDCAAAASVVTPGLYRFRRERLTVGL